MIPCPLNENEIKYLVDQLNIKIKIYLYDSKNKLPVGFPEISESVELLLPLVVGVSKKLSYPKVSNFPKSKQFRLVSF